MKRIAIPHVVLAGLAGALGLGGCGDLSGFGGTVSPLATARVQVTGDFASVQTAPDPTLRVAMVWGAQWLVEPLCILPAENDSVAAVIAAGCRDPFGFVPRRVGENVPLGPDGTAIFELYDLPNADVMVGDVTARVGYASLVVYDDRDDNGSLTLARPNRLPGRLDDFPDDPGLATLDIVYGASFVSMTQPDTRLAFREGGFNAAAAFYPRRGCGEPLPSFSVVSAGGFTATAALAALVRGELPAQDPATCREESMDATIAIALRPPSEVRQVGCAERRSDSSVRYRQPPVEAPDLTGRTVACAGIPDFGSGKTDGMVQFVISGRPSDSCIGLTHYVLRGCRNDPACELPEWDLTATPPSWWPCPAAQ
jgi:hypothetical protein